MPMAMQVIFLQHMWPDNFFFLLKLHVHNGCHSNSRNVCKFTMCETLAMDVLPLIFFVSPQMAEKNKNKQIRF